MKTNIHSGGVSCQCCHIGNAKCGFISAASSLPQETAGTLDEEKSKSEAKPESSLSMEEKVPCPYHELADDVSIVEGVNLAYSVRIHSWEEFASLIGKMPSKQWCFRGHEVSSWKLQTGLDRIRLKWEARNTAALQLQTERNVSILQPDFIAWRKSMARDRDYERTMIWEFKNQLKLLAHPNGDNLSLLGMMQHYGTKTRLLDFTFSPYVAAFFAFEFEEAFTERAVYAINLGVFGGLSDTLKSMHSFKNGDDVFNEKDLKYYSDLKRLLEEFKSGLIDKWDVLASIANNNIGGTEQEDSSDIIPVRLTTPNQRLIAQSGLFMLPLCFDPFDATLARMMNRPSKEVNEPPFICEKCPWLSDVVNQAVLIRFVFDKSMNDCALLFLRQLNLLPNVIYPDLEGLARSMNYLDT